MNIFKRIIFISGIMFLADNCAALQMNLDTLQKCEVKAKNLQIREMEPGFFGKESRLVLQADLEITNPNPVEATLYKFDLRLLKKDDRENYFIASMKSDKTVKIPPHGKKETSFNITTPAGEKLTKNITNVIASMIRDAAAGTAPVFIIEGKVQLKSGRWNKTVPIRIEQKARL